MSNKSSVVAMFDHHAQAEEAVKQLQQTRFDMKNLSIIGKGYHTEENVVGYYTSGDRMKYWGTNGAFWGAIWGLLFGSAFFLIPGIGPIVVAGPIIASIVAALEGAVVVGGFGALGAGLYSMGISEKSIVQYEASLKADKFLLLLHGTTEEVTRAKKILAIAGAFETQVYMAETPVAELA